jgi:hypothetical protein
LPIFGEGGALSQREEKKVFGLCDVKRPRFVSCAAGVWLAMNGVGSRANNVDDGMDWLGKVEDNTANKVAVSRPGLSGPVVMPVCRKSRLRGRLLQLHWGTTKCGCQAASAGKRLLKIPYLPGSPEHVHVFLETFRAAQDASTVLHTCLVRRGHGVGGDQAIGVKGRNL